MPQYVTTDELHEALTEVNTALLEEVGGADIEPAGDNTKLRTREKVRLVSEEIGEAQREIYGTAHTCEEIVTEGVCVKRLPFDFLRKLKWINTQKQAIKTAIQALGTGMPDNEIFHDYYKWIKGGGGSDPQPDIPLDTWINQDPPAGKITWATPYTLHFKYSQPGTFSLFASNAGYNITPGGTSVVAPEFKALSRVGNANGAVFGYNRTSYDSRLGSVYGITPKFAYAANTSNSETVPYMVPQYFWKNGSSVSAVVRATYKSHLVGYTHREYVGGQYVYSDIREYTTDYTTNGNRQALTYNGRRYEGFYFSASAPSVPSGSPSILLPTERFITNVSISYVFGDIEVPITSFSRIDSPNNDARFYVYATNDVNDIRISIQELPHANYSATLSNSSANYLYKAMFQPNSPSSGYPGIAGFNNNINQSVRGQYLKCTVQGSGGKYQKTNRALGGAFTQANVRSIAELSNGGHLYLDYYWRSITGVPLYDTGTFPPLDPDYTGNQYIAQEVTIEYDFGSEAAPPSVITPEYVGDTSTSRVTKWETPYTPEADSKTRTTQEAETEAEQQTGQPSTDTVTKILAYAVEQIGTPYPPAAEQANGNRFGPNYYDCSGLVYKAVQAGGITIPTVSASQYGYYRSRGGIFTSNANRRPGDLIFWEKISSGARNDDYGSTNYIHHVGLIYSISGDTVLIIDSGSKGVQKRNLWEGSGYVIKGYAHPES